MRFYFLSKIKMSMALTYFKVNFYTQCMKIILNFYINTKESVKGLMKIFNIFWTFSWIKPNESNCDIAGLDFLKGVKLGLCGVEWIDLMLHATKLLGVYYSIDKNFENRKNFVNLVLKIEKLLRLWRKQNLSLAGKTIVFKTLAISKIPHLILVKVFQIQLLNLTK